MQPFSNILEKNITQYDSNIYLNIEDEKLELINIIKFAIKYKWKKENISELELENMYILYINRIIPCIVNCTSTKLLHDLIIKFTIPTFAQILYIKNKSIVYY